MAKKRPQKPPGPASDAQKDLADKLGIRYPPGINVREMSALITEKIRETHPNYRSDELSWQRRHGQEDRDEDEDEDSELRPNPAFAYENDEPPDPAAEKFWSVVLILGVVLAIGFGI
jgi:hypothetical protein